MYGLGRVNIYTHKCIHVYVHLHMYMNSVVGMHIECQNFDSHALSDAESSDMSGDSEVKRTGMYPPCGMNMSRVRKIDQYRNCQLRCWH